MLDDRIEIQKLFEQGVSRAEIARSLGVHRSTITRELRHGSWQPEHDHANLRPYLRNRLDTRDPHERLYLAAQAQLQADTRATRSHLPYRMMRNQLVDWVISALRRGWTPEEIADRLPIEFPDDRHMRLSGALHTTVERCSRFLHAIKLPGALAQATVDAQIAFYESLPAHAVASVTVDNGSEFALHYQLADALAVPTYFADPYSAHQRGTNEHFNGRLRTYLPKGTSFADLSQAELDEFVTEINNRPRKILGWATPAEIFQELCLKDTTTNCCTSD